MESHHSTHHNSPSSGQNGGLEVTGKANGGLHSSV